MQVNNSKEDETKAPIKRSESKPEEGSMYYFHPNIVEVNTPPPVKADNAPVKLARPSAVRASNKAAVR